jgi:energy-converting hydrogenase Eha subunit A
MHEIITKAVALVAAAGGMAALGKIIDMAIRESEEDKLREWLAAWWVRFDDVRWSNFGQKEAEIAIEKIDRWTGRRLLSRQRLKAVTCACGVALIFSLLSVLVRLYLTADAKHSYFDTIVRSFTPDRNYWVLSVAFPTAVLTLAISFSVLRWIATIVSRLQTTGARGVALFSVLLCAHFALLLYWSWISSAIVVIPAMVAVYTINYNYTDTLQNILRWYVYEMFSSPAARIENLFSPFYAPLGRSSGLEATYGHFKSVLDILSNGARIGFALVFLSSFVFGAFLKPITSRVWAGMIDKKIPLFTTLFGLIGTMFCIIAVLLQ